MRGREQVCGEVCAAPRVRVHMREYVYICAVESKCVLRCVLLLEYVYICAHMNRCVLLQVAEGLIH